MIRKLATAILICAVAACSATGRCEPGPRASGFACREECRLLVNGCEFSSSERFAECHRNRAFGPCKKECAVTTVGDEACHTCLIDSDEVCAQGLDLAKRQCAARGAKCTEVCGPSRETGE